VKPIARLIFNASISPQHTATDVYPLMKIDAELSKDDIRSALGITVKASSPVLALLPQAGCSRPRSIGASRRLARRCFLPSDSLDW